MAQKSILRRVACSVVHIVTSAFRTPGKRRERTELAHQLLTTTNDWSTSAVRSSLGHRNTGNITKGYVRFHPDAPKKRCERPPLQIFNAPERSSSAVWPPTGRDTCGEVPVQTDHNCNL